MKDQDVACLTMRIFDADGRELGSKRTILRPSELMAGEYMARTKGKELFMDAVANFGLLDEFKRQRGRPNG